MLTISELVSSSTPPNSVVTAVISPNCSGDRLRAGNPDVTGLLTFDGGLMTNGVNELEETEVPDAAVARCFVALKHHGTGLGRLVHGQGHGGGKEIAFDVVHLMDA